MTNSVTMGSSSKDLDYEVIHTPALKPIPLDPNEELVKISAIPNWAQSAFKEVIQLNRVQSKVYETALFKPDNILLCAPTGAGKSSVAVLTILQRIARHRNPVDGSIDHSAYKILYLVHAEALVVEVVRNLNNCLEEYDGIKIIKLSEEPSLTCQQIQDSQVIVTTPEKWDIVTRKIQHHRIYTQNMKLLIMDEIHLHNDVLESIIARTKMHAKESTRLVGLSANCFNYEDVAKFLHIEAKGLFTFNDAYRHIPISQFLFGIKGEVQCQLQTMNHLCYEKVMAVDKENQILIFVHSREEAAKTARGIIDDAISNGTISRFRKEDSASRKILCTHTDIVMCNDLKYLLPYGLAIHNTNMSSEDCKVVEKLFAQGHLQVLVCDKDFAWGVNLSAHLVIVKGTQFYNPEKGAWTELSPLDVMQMLGHAGSPQRNSYCEGIIFTEHKELQYYHSLMKQQLPIESQFASKLADQLNSEVVLGSVQNVKEARHWIGYTYLYVCMLRDPNSYGLAPDILTSNIALDESKADLIHKAATLLDNSNLVKYHSKSGFFEVADLGRIASYYNITHKTIFMYNERLKSTMEDKELCQLFSLSEEFKNVTVRQDEMTELTKLLDCVPIPIKESLKEPSGKINVLLQAYISQLKLEGLSTTSDMVFITQSVGRLLPALFEIALIRGWAQLAEKALNLCKMVAKRMWSVQTPLRQFNGIPSDIFTKLEKKDLAWERYYDLSSQEIGELIRAPKMGRTLHKFIHQFPKLNLAAHVQPITRTVLGVELTITPDFAWDDRIHGYVEPFWVIVEDNDGEYILHHEYFLLKKQYIEEDHTLNFTVPIYEPLPPQYFIRVVSDKWLGSQTVLPVSFRHLILPEKYTPPTELLDLQPLPVTALRNPSYEALYQEFKHFNPVQTQVFPVLYNSDDNVLVASPTGSDKTICAEFAILRDHQTKSDRVMQIGNNGVMRVVYVSPIEALAKERYRDWKKKFGDGLQLNVVELTGRGATDLILMNQGQIIVSTLEKWDALSRSSNYMMYVWEFTLFIIDGLHLIGRQRGVLETVVSRMRCIASQQEVFKQKIRFVAFSTSLANAKNLGEWIGATSHGIFNFPLGNPLQIHIQEVNVANFEARMQAMTKPTYTAITQHAKNGKSVIVFVPTRKYVRLTAEDLIAYSGADSGEKPFLLKSIEDLEPLINNINDEMLKGTLREGVGYLHEGLNHHDHNIVIQLFETGWIQVCIITSSLSWEVNLSSYSVIVMGMGTQYCDGLEDAQANYSFTDLLQMVGHVNHPLVENDCRECTIFCHAPRKEYYKTLLDGFTVESVLQDFFHDDLIAEIRQKYTFTMEEVMEYYLANSFMAKCLKSMIYCQLYLAEKKKKKG